LENCGYIWESDCGSERGTIDSGEMIPFLSCTKRGKCVLIAGDEKTGGTTTTTTTTTQPVTTTDIPTTTVVTTTVEGEMVKILDEETVSCYHIIKNKCTEDYEYCFYEWNSDCSENEGYLLPGDKAPWMVCNKKGRCILWGKPFSETTSTTTIPTNGCEVIYDGYTTSCYHKSGKKCDEKFDYCNYEWISECSSISGQTVGGNNFPWMVCYKSGICYSEGCY
jgi:hypothetical protein